MILAIAVAAWQLGGLGTILLLGSLFDQAKYHQYIIIALGLTLSLAWGWGLGGARTKSQTARGAPPGVGDKK
ncbi:MAG: hypothetical protein ACIAQ0_06770, partial [Phycisphaerales bacterium JB058]